ncbi:hypothetical protein VA7868_01801 [Vibrio aerogenes CECT 7868]|uniref:Translocation protein TolB n=1 Tax=Vibrio aerogenes CECT 7868 TaxID=1216006 RepID=A0A1M5YK04_9VIBR|nr:hypothetical protein [Vibrio aerogenes]SHI12371.1 hypothetical protein VA7868_01801 [Vibrio aerogenes CECT 7868]
MKRLLLSTLILASVHAYAGVDLTDSGAEKEYELYGASANAQGEFNNAYKYSAYATYSGKYVVFHSSSGNNYNSEGKWGHYVKNTLDGSVIRIPAPEGMDDEKFSKMKIRSMTANGRFLVVDGGVDSTYHVHIMYLYDLKSGKAEIINRDIDNHIPKVDNSSYRVQVSEDGQYIYYGYYGATLEHSSQSMNQVYLWDVAKNIRTRINKDIYGNDFSLLIYSHGQRRISGDGRYLIYATNADLDADNINIDKNKTKIYVYDRVTGKSRLITVNLLSNQWIKATMPAISIDGQFATYLQDSDKINRVNLQTLHREIISQDDQGEQLEHCSYPSISSEGLTLAFTCDERAYLYDYTGKKLHIGSTSLVDGHNAKTDGTNNLTVLDQGNGMYWRTQKAQLLEGEPSYPDYQIYLYRQKPGTTSPQICFSDDY